MKPENIKENELKNENVNATEESKVAADETKPDEVIPSSVTVQEVDTAAINATAAEELPKLRRRQRPKKKGRSVAGQISRLNLALLFLIPLLLVAFWTDVALILVAEGIRGSLFDLPGAYASVNLRGVLQLVLLVS